MKLFDNMIILCIIGILVYSLTFIICGISCLIKYRKRSDENHSERRFAWRLILWGIIMLVLFFAAVLAFIQWVFIPRLVQRVINFG